MSHDLDLDNDPRDPDTQAADFFTRPGDFHQVDLTIPIDDEPLGLKLGAQFVIKFTPDQKPLIIEVLRQLRGALAARITITRMNQAGESDNPGRNSTPNVTDGPPIPMSGSTYLERSRAETLALIKHIRGVEQADRDRQRSIPHAVESHGPPITAIQGLDAEDVARTHGVPADWVHPIPMSNGNTAYTITPPPQATSGGRHAKPEGEQA